MFVFVDVEDEGCDNTSEKKKKNNKSRKNTSTRPRLTHPLGIC
jgi:hypothetical protein